MARGRSYNNILAGKVSREKPPKHAINLLTAEKTVARLQANVMDATVPVTFTSQDVIDWLMPPEMVKAIVAVAPYVDAASELHINDELINTFHRADLRFDFERIGMFAPTKEAVMQRFKNNMPRAIRDCLDGMCKVRNSFDNVLKVVNWFLEHNATPGAIRYYWPTAMVLTPDDTALQEASGARFKDINGIQEIIPLLKETQATVATAFLLGSNDEARKEEGFFSATVGSADGASVRYGYKARVLL